MLEIINKMMMSPEATIFVRDKEIEDEVDRKMDETELGEVDSWQE